MSDQGQHQGAPLVDFIFCSCGCLSHAHSANQAVASIITGIVSFRSFSLEISRCLAQWGISSSSSNGWVGLPGRDWLQDRVVSRSCNAGREIYKPSRTATGAMAFLPLSRVRKERMIVRDFYSCKEDRPRSVDRAHKRLIHTFITL